MARRETTLTLTLDFEVEKQKLQEVGNLLGRSVEKNLHGEKTLEYFTNLKQAINDVVKTASGLYSNLSKPLGSKTEAKEFAHSLETAFKTTNDKLLSLQGNISRTFESVSNVEALKQIRELGAEIEKLTADYKAVTQLLNDSKSIGTNKELNDQLSKARKEYNQLVKKGTELTKEEIKRQEELKQIMDEVNAKLEAKNKLKSQISDIHAANGVSSQAELGALIDEKANEQKGLINGSMSIEEFKTLKIVLEQVRDVFREIMTISNATTPKVTQNWNQVSDAAYQAEQQTKSFTAVLRELGLPVLSLQGIASLIRRIGKYSYDYIKNLDAALTEISVVSGKTRNEVLALTDTFIELSAKTGMAIDDIAQASTIFYQQGLGDEAVKKLTEYTAIFAKISNESVEVASNQITAAINGFGMGVDRAGEVIDKLSVLAAHSAASIDELATAMSKAASQAKMAGLSFDQYNAYLATMIEVTREAPENIGTSLKTIMSRFQQIKKGENTEDDTDVNAVETALRSVNVALRDSQGQLRDLGDVLEDLGPKWKSLSRNTQTYLGTIIAGTRQQSRFVSLMQNWDRALELTAQSENSAGAATRMHAAAMQSLEASLQRLTNAWQNLISSIENGNDIKGIVDWVTKFVKWLGDGNSIIKILTVAINLFNIKTIATYVSAKNVKHEIHNLNTAFTTLRGKIKTLSTDMSNLSKQQIQEESALEKEKLQVDNLAASYNNLAIAKQMAAGTYNGSAGTQTHSSTKGISADVHVTTYPGLNALNGSMFVLDKNAKHVSVNVDDAGRSVGKLAGNIGKILGPIQTALGVGTLIYSFASDIIDLFTTTAEEIREVAEKEYQEIQEKMDKEQAVIDAVKNNLDVYEKLNKKVNKSTEEIEEMAKAADNLARAIPGALVGYDSNGNAIIDPTNARAAEKEARENLANEAKEQMGSIGNLARAEIREVAEKNVANNANYDKWQNGGLIAAGIGGGALAGMGVAALTNAWNPAGWIIGIAAGITALGLVITGASTVAKEAAINEEQLTLAREKASKITEEYGEQLKRNLVYVTDNQLSDKTIDGTNRVARSTMAAYIGNEWLSAEQQDLFNKFYNGEINEKQWEAEFKGLGTKWEQILSQFGEKGLASAFNSMNELAEDLGDKTYSEVEQKIVDAVKKANPDLDENSPLFKTIESAFMKAVYSGYQKGIYAVVKGMQNSKIIELTRVGNLYGEDSDEYKLVEEKWDKAIDIIKNKLTNNEVSFFDTVGLTENATLFLMTIEQYGDRIRDALKQGEDAAAIETIAFLDSIRVQAEQKMAECTEDMEEEYEYWKKISEETADAIEDCWNSLDISVDIPWETLWKDFEKSTERVNEFRIAWSKMASGSRSSGLSESEFKSFTTMLDKINYENFDDAQLNQYAESLNTIAGSLTVVNGQIYANGEAIKNIADLEQAAMEAGIKTTRQELINKKLELEAGRAIVQAQIKTIEWKIAEAENSEKAEKLKTEAQEAWTNASSVMSTWYLGVQKKTTEAQVRMYGNAFAEILVKYNKLQTAIADGSVTQKEINALTDAWSNAQQKLTFDNFSDELMDKTGGDVNKLKAQLEAAKKLDSQYNWEIGNINLKLALLDSGLRSAENGVAKETDKNKNKITQYIGQLKEIYNILNRIDMLEHRLNTLDTYADISKEEVYGNLLNQRLGYNQELLNQYDFLVSEQKKFTNGYKDFIGTVDGLEGVFDFDKYGQIIINWEKYINLQDRAANGEVTLKQKADDVYETYQRMFDELKKDFDNYIKYLKNVINLLQEVIDAYDTTEAHAVSAIKEIYQKILNDRLDAIDKEKKAIDELQEARNRARKDQENAKTMSGLQTNLQRAMMDTSGASDSNFIKAQKDIEDKLDEIADDKYSQMLDDIQKALDEEKDALQEDFEQLWENLDWLHEWLDTDIMENKDVLFDLFQQTEEWQTASPSRRTALVQEWGTLYSTYMTQLTGGKTIFDIWTVLNETRGRIGDLDFSLQTDESKDGKEIIQTIKSWQKDTTTAINTAVTKAVNGVATKLGSTYTPKPQNKIEPTENTSPTAEIGNLVTQAAKNIANALTSSSHFSVGDKVRSSSGKKYINPYDQDDKGNLKTPPHQTFTNQAYWGSSSNAYPIVAKKTVNGAYYYKVELGPYSHYWLKEDQLKYKKGGFVYGTGPAWLDGTATQPEAVLNALQTKHFIDFTNALDKMYAGVGATNSTSSVSIDNISFNVESMSSPEDGEKAFNMFVTKFKEIGNQTGLAMNNFKNNI